MFFFLGDGVVSNKASFDFFYYFFFGREDDILFINHWRKI